MLKSELREIILLQNRKSENRELIERDLYRNLEEQIRNPFIIILSGIRRCGKSTLLWQLMQKYPGHYLNFDDERLARFTVEDFQLLYECFLELYGNKNLFYFDEIQNVSGWEKFARRLHDEGKKLFLTGSNATMLSRELGTRLTGRHLQYNVFPFSFPEFLKFKKTKFSRYPVGTEKSELINLFSEYIQNCGFPEYLQTKNAGYLKFLYDNILYRDVLVRHNIAHEKSMRELIGFIASNISKEISFNSIKSMLNLGSSTTVKDYFGYLEDSFLIFLIPKFEYSLKKQIYANKKAYFIDTAMALYLGYRFSEDKGRLLENIVFLDLKRRKKDVCFHKENSECDFICSDYLKVTFKADMAIQVCYEITSENKDREVQGILEAMKKHKLKEGLILTFEQDDELKINNRKIIIKPVWRWIVES